MFCIISIQNARKSLAIKRKTTSKRGWFSIQLEAADLPLATLCGMFKDQYTLTGVVLMIAVYFISINVQKFVCCKTFQKHIICYHKCDFKLRGIMVPFLYKIVEKCYGHLNAFSFVHILPFSFQIHPSF